MSLIELSCFAGHPVYVESTRVIAIRPSDFDHRRAVVSLDAGPEVCVMESTGDVREKLRALEQKAAIGFSEDKQ